MLLRGITGERHKTYDGPSERLNRSQGDPVLDRGCPEIRLRAQVPTLTPVVKTRFPVSSTDIAVGNKGRAHKQIYSPLPVLGFD